MTPRAELKTARLTLRPVMETDQAAVVAALNNLDVTGWLSVVPYPYSPADFHQFLGSIAKPGQTFAVLDTEGLAGIVGAGQELGYWFMPRCHGRGYATEAARAVMANQLAHDPGDVASGYFEGNHRSANVLKKLGFVETGRGLRPCRALGHDRPHVNLRLTAAAFRAALPWAATSPRLTYRPLQAIDCDALHAIVSHQSVTRQLGDAWPWPADPAFTATRAQPFTGDGFAWGIFRNSHLIGTVAVTNGELGYMLHPAHHHQGLGFEAAETALARAFQAQAKVKAAVWADNRASLNLLQKLGFTQTGQHHATNACRPERALGLDLILTSSAFHIGKNIPPEVWRV